MADVFSQVNSAASLAKTLLSLPAVSASADAKLAVAELQLQLAEVKSQLAELMEENREFKETIAKLTLPLPVDFKDGKYFKHDGDGPFCTGCYDSKKQMIRIVRMASTLRTIGRWKCPECETTYQ